MVDGYYWSSSPHYYYDHALAISISDYSVYPDGYYGRNGDLRVRCLKDSTSA
jgi:hypothetical protein